MKPSSASTSIYTTTIQRLPAAVRATPLTLISDLPIIQRRTTILDLQYITLQTSCSGSRLRPEHPSHRPDFITTTLRRLRFGPSATPGDCTTLLSILLLEHDLRKASPDCSSVGDCFISSNTSAVSWRPVVCSKRVLGVHTQHQTLDGADRIFRQRQANSRRAASQVKLSSTLAWGVTVTLHTLSAPYRASPAPDALQWHSTCNLNRATAYPKKTKAPNSLHSVSCFPPFKQMRFYRIIAQPHGQHIFCLISPPAPSRRAPLGASAQHTQRKRGPKVPIY